MEFSRQVTASMNLRNRKANVGGIAAKGGKKALADNTNKTRRPLAAISKNIKPAKDDLKKLPKEKPVDEMKKLVKEVRKDDFENATRKPMKEGTKENLENVVMKPKKVTVIDLGNALKKVSVNDSENALKEVAVNDAENALKKPVVEMTKVLEIVEEEMEDLDIGQDDMEIALKKPLDVVTEVEQSPMVEDNCTDLDMYPLRPLPANVDDIDCDDDENPQLVSEYIMDIYRYLWKLEEKYPIKKNFLRGHAEVNGKMRGILIDWLIQVHGKFQLLQETLYLTVSILDRFLQVQEIRKARLQLVGVSAMFIASKYEEMYAPEVHDFVYITDGTFNKAEILSTECVILRKLEFSFSKPIPLHFLRRDSKAGNVDPAIHTLAKYLMELTLPEYEFAHFPPSMIAAAALCLSLKLLDNSPWTETLAYYSHYTEDEIMLPVCGICKLLLRRRTNRNAQALNQKYGSSKLMKISSIPELESELVIKLAAELDRAGE